MAHIAVMDTGRVGGEVAFTLAFERYVTELSLVDVAPDVAEMTKEEVHHAVANHGSDVKINAHTNSARFSELNATVKAQA